MSKKVKCIDCVNRSSWACMDKVNDKNYEYAKSLLLALKSTICCMETMKTKGINHEQYCKKFQRENEFFTNITKRESPRF